MLLGKAHGLRGQQRNGNPGRGTSGGGDQWKVTGRGKHEVNRSECKLRSIKNLKLSVEVRGGWAEVGGRWKGSKISLYLWFNFL